MRREKKAPETKQGDYKAIIVLAIVVLLAFMLLVISAQKNSQTTDESVHLNAGYTYLTQRDFRFDPEHPPLLKELGAAPLLLFRDLSTPPTELWDDAADYYRDSWREARVSGELFLYGLGNDPQRMLFWSRFPFIVLTLILGLFAFFWARKLYGIKAGVFAAFLTLLCPNILANGILVNTDLGLTLFIFVAIYFSGKYLKNPNWKDLVFSGFFSGCAFASKYTSLLLIPILFVILIERVILCDRNAKRLAEYALGFAATLAIGFIVIWASYGFLTNTPPSNPAGFPANNTFVAATDTSTLNATFQKFRAVLFPAAFYKGLYYVSTHAASGHNAFLLGMHSPTGWWYYFPVAIFYKTPIPFFLLLLLAIIFYKRTAAEDRFDELLLITPAVVFLLLAMASKTNLGVRHVLPIFPFLFVFISKAINLISLPAGKANKKKSARKAFLPAAGFLLLIAWYLYSALATFPNYLAYFNEFAGGPNGGYRILTDSNLDWGQDLYRIKDYLTEHQITRFYMIYGWDGPPSLLYYDLQPLPLPRYSNQLDEKFIISATSLQDGHYDWLKTHSHQQITPGVFIFDPY